MGRGRIPQRADTVGAGTGTVTGVTASLPLLSSGGVVPNISVQAGTVVGQLLRWDGATWVHVPAVSLLLDAITSIAHQLGGVATFSEQQNLLGAGEADLVSARALAILFAQGPAGTDGFPLVVRTVSPPAVGARARGGDINFETGSGDGNAGAGADGGSFVVALGDGSSNSGNGGDFEFDTGNGGAPNGNAGSWRTILGQPQGGGNEGTWTLQQGGAGGPTQILLDGSGRVHIGDDTDTTNVNLRVNGAEQTTVGAAGLASALPALPLGYKQIDFNGTVVVVPFYNQA